jgi:RNA polymerase sigma-70 factor (ECF subfamily)
MDDTEAITRLKRGDIGGLAVLVERYQVRAVQTAFLITRDRARAEDVVQATFIRAYHAIGGFDARRPFAPWFLRSVVNAAVQSAREQARSFSLDGALDEAEAWIESLPDPALSPHDEAEAAELRRQVWDALERLTPTQRAAVVMRYFLELSEGEISERLHSPPGTIRWRLHEARRRLRHLLVETAGALER